MGALQVGMLQALFEHGIRPDLVLGCSVGALNGVAVAADPSLSMVHRLRELWRDIDDKKVLPNGLLPTTVQLARRGVSVHGNESLRAVIDSMLEPQTFEELAVPFQCVATAIDEAREVWFEQGPLVEPILASAALPAVLPPVEIDGVRYMDGAVVNEIPVNRALELGATSIYVLSVGSVDRPRPEPRRPIDMALTAYWIARRNRFTRDLAAVPPGVEVVIMPTGEAPLLRFHDLEHSEELIDIAYEASYAALELRAGREPPERVVRPIQAWVRAAEQMRVKQAPR